MIFFLKNYATDLDETAQKARVSMQRLLSEQVFENN